MPQHEDPIRLQHMLEAAKKAHEFVNGLKRQDLQTDEKLTFALLRLLEVIGEAAKNISPETRERYSQIAWKGIAGTRDRLIHGYFDVDLDIIWRIVAKDLPPLIAELEKIIPAG